MDLNERFDLLVDSGQVTAEAAAAAAGVIAGVVAYIGRPLDQDAGSMIATHLAFAMERLARNVPVAEPPEAALEEARSYPQEWDAAVALLEQSAAVWGRSAPPNEIVYLTFHLRSLVGELG